MNHLYNFVLRLNIFRIFISIVGLSFIPLRKVDIKAIEKLDKYKGVISPVIIIGSGPAGQAAAFHLARLIGKVVVLEGEDHGQLEYTSTVENILYLKSTLGSDLNETAIQQARSFGAIFIKDSVASIDFKQYPFHIKTSKGKSYYALSLIIAIGSKHKQINCKNLEKFIAKGVYYCAKCDGPLYANQDVVVIGGGDSACEEALQLSHIAKNVTILVKSNKLRASSQMIKKVLNVKKIKILYNTKILELEGNEKLTSAIIKKDGIKEKINVSAVFVAIGYSPNSDILKSDIQLDSDGYVVCQGKTQSTSLNGVFAAGDICDSQYRQVSTAIGDGTKAALDAIRFLESIDVNSSFIETTDIWIANEENEKINRKEERERLVININSDLEFEKLIKDKLSNKIYIIDFFAPWCPPCKKMKKVFEQYVQNEDSFDIIFVDIDKNPKTAAKFNVSSIPTIILMSGNKIVNSFLGYKDIDSLLSWIRENKVS